ncbi:zf-HC2 domain-containing protein [Streptomyces sp. ISL-11]|uniref:anti-sigma factor family protein n=1 Tax=Streptomyces sp. ISL-11 TaxID=2819174 RepID=UPI0027E4A963|nr:zf-HC2 domain-containing protein [Streptomyces sp. ISL-11]
MSGSGGQSPAEHHLGDRLAALVDGELGHDSRERVLAHLATCWKCKAEADAQRRLKSVFAESALPPLSDALLARLQGLPARGPDGDGEGAGGQDGPDGRQGPGGPGKGGFDARAEAFAMFPAVTARHRDGGFRIHDVPDTARSGSRGRRFAFAAAGAVSLAAFALGGAQPLGAVVESPGARAEDPRSSSTPTVMSGGGLTDTSLPLGFTAATRDAPRAPGAPPEPPARGVSLLRPAVAPPLAPLLSAAFPAPGASAAGGTR